MSKILPRESYEGTGGWNDGRLGQARDLIDETYRMGSERGISYVLAKQREATPTRDTGGEG